MHDCAAVIAHGFLIEPEEIETLSSELVESLLLKQILLRENRTEFGFYFYTIKKVEAYNGIAIPLNEALPLTLSNKFNSEEEAIAKFYELFPEREGEKPYSFLFTKVW